MIFAESSAQGYQSLATDTYIGHIEDLFCEFGIPLLKPIPM